MSAGPSSAAQPSEPPAPSVISPDSVEERDDAAAFAGRVARWDPMSPVRLRQDGQLIRLWATTPFDTLATRAVTGTIEPADVTVYAGNLLSALAIATSGRVDPGPAIDASWRAQLPPNHGFVYVDVVPAKVLAELADEGTARARVSAGPAGGASTSLLDSEVITVQGNGMKVPVPLRVLFALSGMGFAGTGQGEKVRVSATDSWLRIDARFGAVVRRRHSLLPLFV